MEFAYHLDGGSAPYVKKYQIGEDMTLPGIPVVKPTLSDTSGVLKAATTTAVDYVGVTIDVAASSSSNPGVRLTAQQTGDAKVERVVSVIINPFAVFKARLSGGAAAGTILGLIPNTVADVVGTLLTSTTVGTGYDDGYFFGYDGANAGLLRKGSAVSATAATFVVAFDHNIAVGDNFIACTFGPAEANGVQLCTELTEINITGDNQAGTDTRCVELQFKDKAGSGRTESYAFITFTDSLFIA